MSEKVKPGEDLDRRDRSFGGVLLIALGLLVLFINLTRLSFSGSLVLLFLAVIFLAWGFYTHRAGFAVPGCILGGLGIGMFLVERIPSLAGTDSGGVIVLGLAGGFAALTVVFPLIEQKRALWALIPAAILGLVGLLIVIGGEALNILQFLGNVWPLILVAIGVYILIAPRQRHN